MGNADFVGAARIGAESNAGDKAGASIEALAMHPVIRQLDFTSLRMFLVTAQVGSMAQAAQIIAIAPSALSRRMRELEDALGVQLLVRTTEGIRLTEAGLVVQQHAERQLGALRDMVDKLNQFGPAKRGAITLVINQSSLDTRFCELLASLVKLHPHIDVSIEVRKGTEVRDAVLSGYADLAVGNEWYLNQGELTTYLFRKDRFVVIGAVSFQASAGASMRFKDVLQWPLIGLSKGSAYNRWLEGHAAALGARLQFRSCVSHFQALVQLARAGIGVGIVPEPFLSTMPGSGDTDVLPLEEDWAYKNVVICHRAGQVLSPAAGVALDFFRGRRVGQTS